MFLHTLIIGHKSGNMLGILHKLTTRQRKFQIFVTNNVFLDPTPSQLRAPNVDKLFNCFVACSRNINKQSRFGGIFYMHG